MTLGTTAIAAIDAMPADEAERVLLFHHDPLHTDDDLDRLRDRALERWHDQGAAGDLAMAVEGSEIDVTAELAARAP